MGAGITTKEFDCDAFYEAINTTREVRNLNWKQVAGETGVGASTLTRMSQGKRPDADSLAFLAAWSGLNPASFVTGNIKPSNPEPLVMLASSLKSDPSLLENGAEALEEIFKTAYKQFQRKD